MGVSGVLALVLAAAFAHAGWNFLAKGAEGARPSSGCARASAR